jgi:hypothetical protein
MTRHRLHEPGSRNELMFLALHAGLFPLMGAAVAVSVFSYGVRAFLPWSAAAMDGLAVLCGAAGVLFGGIGGFALADRRHVLGAIAWPRVAIRVGLSEAAVLGSLVLAGVPPTGTTLWLATLAAVGASVVTTIVAGVVLARRGLES